MVYCCRAVWFTKVWDETRINDLSSRLVQEVLENFKFLFYRRKKLVSWWTLLFYLFIWPFNLLLCRGLLDNVVTVEKLLKISVCAGLAKKNRSNYFVWSTEKIVSLKTEVCEIKWLMSVANSMVVLSQFSKVYLVFNWYCRSVLRFVVTQFFHVLFYLKVVWD